MAGALATYFKTSYIYRLSFDAYLIDNVHFLMNLRLCHFYLTMILTHRLTYIQQLNPSQNF